MAAGHGLPEAKAIPTLRECNTFAGMLSGSYATHRAGLYVRNAGTKRAEAPAKLGPRPPRQNRGTSR